MSSTTKAIEGILTDVERYKDQEVRLAPKPIGGRLVGRVPKHLRPIFIAMLAHAREEARIDTERRFADGPSLQELSSKEMMHKEVLHILFWYLVKVEFDSYNKRLTVCDDWELWEDPTPPSAINDILGRLFGGELSS